MSFPTNETIKFEFHLVSEYWRRPPKLQILVDHEEKFNGEILRGTQVITFEHTCNFEFPHKLTIIRSGKTNFETKRNSDGSYLTQMLTLQKLKIDGIDIRDIVWTKSVMIPEYPEPWATEQKLSGNVLEEKIIGCTEFGHNSVWYLDFTSPFYFFIMKWMNGEIR